MPFICFERRFSLSQDATFYCCLLSNDNSHWKRRQYQRYWQLTWFVRRNFLILIIFDRFVSAEKKNTRPSYIPNEINKRKHYIKIQNKLLVFLIRKIKSLAFSIHKTKYHNKQKAAKKKYKVPSIAWVKRGPTYSFFHVANENSRRTFELEIIYYLVLLIIWNKRTLLVLYQNHQLDIKLCLSDEASVRGEHFRCTPAHSFSTAAQNCLQHTKKRYVVKQK